MGWNNETTSSNDLRPCLAASWSSLTQNLACADAAGHSASTRPPTMPEPSSPTSPAAGTNLSCIAQAEKNVLFIALHLVLNSKKLLFAISPGDPAHA